MRRFPVVVSTRQHDGTNEFLPLKYSNSKPIEISSILDLRQYYVSSCLSNEKNTGSGNTKNFYLNQKNEGNKKLEHSVCQAR